MLIEKIIFSLLAIILFVRIFVKMILKNDTSYIYFLILQFIGICIKFYEIINVTDVLLLFNISAYLLSIILPLIIILLELNDKNLIEYLYLLLAKILKKVNITKSKKILINLLNKFPQSYYGHRMLADIYKIEGGSRKAIDEYVKAIDINKKDYDSYFEIANLLNELDKKEESIEMLTTLVSKKPDYYKASILLGSLLCEKEQFKEAISVYNNALKYDSSNYDIYYNLGIAYTRLNDFQTAKRYYDMAAEINAELYYAYYNLGIISLILGDYKEAKQYFIKSLKGSYVEAKGYYNLAKICIIDGEKENAINYLNNAIEIDGKISYLALEDEIFIPIKKYIHIPQNIKEEIEKKDISEKEIKVKEHLEKTYEIVGTISKNQLKRMNSFKDDRIQLNEKERE